MRLLHVCSALVFAGTCLVGTAQASNALDAGAVVSTLREEGKHAQAADAGLAALLESPWDHTLRYLVADSLQQAGRLSEAAEQFSALDGTALATAAAPRLAALGGRARAQPTQPTTPVQNPAPALPTRSTAPALPARGTAPALPTRGTAPALPTRGTAPALPTRGTAPALPTRGTAPALPTRGTAPALPTRGTAPALPTQNPAPTRPAPTRLRDRLTLPAPAPETEAAAQLNALYAKGEYATVAKQGLAQIESKQASDALRLKIANSMAWTGRTVAAQKQYRALLNSSHAREARIGLANTHRWNGRADLALPLYEQVLARHPNDTDATEGRKASLRELAPRTLLSATQTRDSNPIERETVSVSHRWRNEAGTSIYEVGFSRDQDLSITPPAEASRRTLTGRYENLAHPLQPRIEINAQPKPHSSVFGNARFRLGERSAWVHAGHIDWGKLALSPRASQIGLTANHLGLEGRFNTGIGQFSAQLDQYDVSDGNVITTASATYSPTWRPLGRHLRPFLATEMREARFATIDYWSPAQGHGSLSAGFSGQWSADRWDYFASAQYGVPLAEESGTAWSLFASGRYWVSRDIAVGFTHWRMSSWRNDAAYRSHATSINLETLWP